MRPKVDLSKVKEAMTNTDAGFSFLEIKDNNLKDGAMAMLDRLNEMDVDDERNLIHEPTGHWHATRVDAYMAAKRRFLELLMLIFHMTGGMPARGTEIGSIKFRNSQHSKRNFYIVDGKAFYYTEYHKTRRAKRASYHIVRYLPQRVGELAVLYLTYIRPFATLLYDERAARQIQWDGDFFFSSDENPDQSWDKKLSSIMMAETEARMGMMFGVAIYRHMAFAIARHYAPEAAKDFEFHDSQRRLMSWQGGHCKGTNVARYGVDSAYPAKLQPELLADYWQASKAWHAFLCLLTGQALDSDSGAETNDAEDELIDWMEEGDHSEHRSATVGDAETSERDDDNLEMEMSEWDNDDPNEDWGRPDSNECSECDDQVIDPEPEDPEPWMRREEERGLRWMAEQNALSAELSTKPVVATSEIECPLDSEPPYVTFEESEDLYGMPSHSPLEPSPDNPRRRLSPAIPQHRLIPVIPRRQTSPAIPQHRPTSEIPRRRSSPEIPPCPSPEIPPCPSPKIPPRQLIPELPPHPSPEIPATGPFPSTPKRHRMDDHADMDMTPRSWKIRKVQEHMNRLLEARARRRQAEEALRKAQAECDAVEKVFREMYLELQDA